MLHTVHCLDICDIQSVSKTVSISILGVRGGGYLTQLGESEKAGLAHWATGNVQHNHKKEGFSHFHKLWVYRFLYLTNSTSLVRSLS